MAFKPSKDNTGRMFDNKADKTNEKQPDYSGTAMVNGVFMHVVAWRNPPTETTKKATLSLRFEEYEARKERLAQHHYDKQPKRPGGGPVPIEDADDLVPF